MAGTFDYFWSPSEGTDVEDIRALVPYVIKAAPGKDPEEVRAALQMALYGFLRATGVWTKEVPALAEDGVVTVATEGAARVFSVLKITRDSDGVAVYSAEDPRWSGRGLSCDDAAGRFSVELPTEDGETYTATVALVNDIGSDYAPVAVLRRWGEAIAAKAAHDLLTGPQPAVTTHYLIYNDAVREILARRAMSGSARGSGIGNALGALERL